MGPETKFQRHHEELISNFQDHYESARRSPRDSLERLVEFLSEKLLPHAKAEEEELYSMVDRKAGSELATASMRKDHRTLEERIQALSRGREDPPEDFPRKLDEFSAILLNHFHKEEQILIPFLSEHLSESDFEALLENVHRAERKFTATGSDR